MLNITARQIQLLEQDTEQLENYFNELYGKTYPLEQFKAEIKHKVSVHGKGFYREELAFNIASKQLELEGIDAIAQVDKD